jgi:mannonate dehydratase
MLMPDHVPAHSDPGSALQGLAFSYGYIKAMIQAVNSEVS